MMELDGQLFIYNFNSSFQIIFSVPKEKFVEYITNSNDYKHHFDPAVV